MKFESKKTARSTHQFNSTDSDTPSSSTTLVLQPRDTNNARKSNSCMKNKFPVSMNLRGQPVRHVILTPQTVTLRPLTTLKGY